MVGLMHKVQTKTNENYVVKNKKKNPQKRNNCLRVFLVRALIITVLPVIAHVVLDFFWTSTSKVKLF